MGLFSRKNKEPLQLPEVSRVIIARADEAAIEAHSRAYDEIAGLIDPSPVVVRDHDGWVGLTLPPVLHPWAFHNFAMWMLDTTGVDAQHLIAISGPAGDQPGYWLINDEHDSWLSGYDDRGSSITVSVPENGVVRGDSLDHPCRTLQQVLDEMGAPADLAEASDDGAHVLFKFEHPQRDLNPTNADTADSRAALARFGQSWL